MPHLKLLDEIFETLPDGRVQSVTIGLNWTVVVVEVRGKLLAGLASNYDRNGVDEETLQKIRKGSFAHSSALDLASLMRLQDSQQVSIGAAAVNALLPRQPDSWQDINAEDVIAQHGAGKKVTMVGHFPFTERLRENVGELNVLEKYPRPGDLPAEAAPDVIPTSKVVAITGSTLLNGTFQSLLDLCSPEALVIVLGPTTFLSPVLFDYGVDILCGSIVVDIPSVVQAVPGAQSFSQVHSAGVRLVAMQAGQSPV